VGDNVDKDYASTRDTASVYGTRVYDSVHGGRTNGDSADGATLLSKVLAQTS